MLRRAMTMTVVAAGLVATSALGIATSLQRDDVPKVEEKESDHLYPAWIDSTLPKPSEKSNAKADDGDGDKASEASDAVTEKPERKKLDLMGLGIREKFVINVYSYALYVERDFVQDELAEFKGVKLYKLEKSDKLYTRLLSQNATKELRLRFCRDVDADDASDAFEKSLEPRILSDKKFKKGTREEKLADLKTFKSFFSLDELEDGKELRFTWHPDGTLSTIVDGERKPDIESRSLCWALFDVYLGSDPISKSGKKKLVHRLPDLLKNPPGSK